ncbi:hypothetical protein BDEG_26019 [Batrachochytrium dendrobatidis JEL423]|uniref:Uncharacterized protein n=1 Tax=Batrachochytrium dendrobatidis (strain JEL423) TaxID=403673 RepID=A0A177WRY0_BATDL|nr:hypothetical protein BDEG_26019 [Batrachochytrium dendrobatidis JEL423]
MTEPSVTNFTAAVVPDSTTAEPDTHDEAPHKESAYTDAVNKRLRTLRKKLLKIVKYEQSNPDDLNPDQLLSVRRKPEIVIAIKELEDFSAQIAVIDHQNAELLKQKEVLQCKEVAVQIAAAEVAAKSVFDKQLESFLYSWYALNIALPQTSTISLSAPKIEALLLLKAALGGQGVPCSEVFAYIESAKLHVEALAKQSESFFPQSSLTYASLGSLLNDLIFPPPPPQFGTTLMADLADDVKEEIIAEPEPSHVDESALKRPGLISRGNKISINFLVPSEVLDKKLEQDVHSQELIPESDADKVSKHDPLLSVAASAAESVSAPQLPTQPHYTATKPPTDAKTAVDAPLKARTHRGNGRRGRGGSNHVKDGNNKRDNKPRAASTMANGPTAESQTLFTKRRSRHFDKPNMTVSIQQVQIDK